MENNVLVKEFMELVKIGAASGDERGIADALRKKLEDMGCVVTEDNAGETFGGNTGNLFTAIEGGLPGSILFTSHMDRVAGGYGVNPSVKDGRIVTDGTTVLSADDLSGAMSIINGVRNVLASGKPFPRIEILFCVGEEIGLLGSKAFDSSVLQSKIGYALDSPGHIGRVIRAVGTRASLECEVFGRAAHAGNEPEKGINAVTVLAKILADIKDGRIDADTTANMAVIKTKCPSINAVQEHAMVYGEVRCVSKEKLMEYIEYFHKHCQEKAEGTGARVETRAKIGYPSFDVPEDSLTVNLVKKVFDDMGIQISVERSAGGMDANNLNGMGVACVGLATGYFDNHTPKESLDIADFLKSGEMVERLIWEYANQNK